MDISHIARSLLEILLEMAPYVLLGFFVAGLLHAFVSQKTMSRHLAGNGWKPVVKAALFGIPLPLCSCGVLPTAVSLRRNGASRGATTSFLIATPQTGVDSIAATWSLLGLPFAILRPIAALAGAMAGGCTVAALVPEDGTSGNNPAETTVCADGCTTSDAEARPRGFRQRMLEAIRYGFVEMVASVGKWLVIGLVIAALITAFVPQDLFVWLNRYPFLAMLGVLAVAIPMYICATGSIPIALSLMLKGLSPGSAFVLLMAGPAVNFASVLVLKNTQGKKATAIYIGSVIVSAIVFGLAIDFLMPSDWFTPSVGSVAGSCHMTYNWFQIVCAVVLSVLLVYAPMRTRRHSHTIINENSKNTDMNTMTITVKGMSCNHCRTSVEKAIAGVPGVESVEVTLTPGQATVTGDFDPAEVKKAITLAGFDPE